MNQQSHHSKHGRCRIPAILVGVLLASLSMMTPSAVQAKDLATPENPRHERMLDSGQGAVLNARFRRCRHGSIRRRQRSCRC